MTARWLEQIRWQPVLLRLLALVGLAVSSALVADDVFGVGTFCGANDPCADVAASAYGHVLGVPLAAVGLAGFGLFLVVSLIPGRWAAAVVRLMAAVAGLAGVGLLFIQLALLRQVCPYCLVADLSAVGLALVALVRPLPADRPAWWAVQVFGWLWAGLAAGLAPLFCNAAKCAASLSEATSESE